MRSDIYSASSRKTVDRRPYINIICHYADQHGLKIQDLRSLLDLAISNSSLSQAHRGLIFKSLYPARKVPPDVIYKAVGSLGHGVQRPPASTQVALIRWLIMVHCTFEDARALRSLYGRLFNLLGRMDIRAPLCHVLAMITKRKHVKPYRRDILQQLALDAPREPGLEKLVRIYDNVGSRTADAAGAAALSISFPHPDTMWGEQLQMIQQQAGVTGISLGLYTQPFVFTKVRNGLQSSPHSLSIRPSKRSRDAYEMTNFDDMAQHLETLALPEIKIQDLDNRLLHQYLLTQSEETIERQLDGLHKSLFDKELEGIAKGREPKSRTLEDSLNHTRLAMVRSPLQHS